MAETCVTWADVRRAIDALPDQNVPAVVRPREQAASPVVGVVAPMAFLHDPKFGPCLEVSVHADTGYRDPAFGPPGHWPANGLTGNRWELAALWRQEWTSHPGRYPAAFAAGVAGAIDRATDKILRLRIMHNVTKLEWDFRLDVEPTPPAG